MGTILLFPPLSLSPSPSLSLFSMGYKHPSIPGDRFKFVQFVLELFEESLDNVVILIANNWNAIN